MIHYICRDGRQDTVAPFLLSGSPALRRALRVTPYERIFSEGTLPAGHLIFTDLDLLSGDELEDAQAIAESMRVCVPNVTIFNEPADVLQRYAMLATLWNKGINPFRAVRLDDTIPPLNYPVFLRREDGALGPETGLIASEWELHIAIAALKMRRVPLRNRIAVEYCAEPGEDGFFRKYGAFRVGKRILPQHIQFSKSWSVKQETSVITPEFVAEEERYIAENPHEEELRSVFDIAQVSFGRIDYGFVNGRMVVYEINTNPTFPHGNHRNGREHLRQVAADVLAAIILEADTHIAQTGTVFCDLKSRRIHTRRGHSVPQRGFELVGRSSLLDRMIGLYWNTVPEGMRRRLPASLKKNLASLVDLLPLRGAG